MTCLTIVRWCEVMFDFFNFSDMDSKHMITNKHSVLYTCKVTSCTNAALRNRKNKSFFKFPRNPEIRKLWKRSCDIGKHGDDDDDEKCDNYRICEDHFVESDFRGSKRLAPFAVPSQKVDVINSYSQVIEDHDYCSRAPWPEMYSCSVPGCSKPKATLHHFPRPNAKTATEWKKLIFRIWRHRVGDENVFRGFSDIEIFYRLRICGVHFTDCCRQNNTGRLKLGSLPTLSMPGFHGEPNDTNSQIALLQKCPDSVEMQLFGGDFYAPVYRENSNRINDTPPPEEVVDTTNNEEQVVILNEPMIEDNPTPDDEDVEQENQPIFELQKPYFKSIRFFSCKDRCVQDVCRICFLVMDSECERIATEPIKHLLQQVLPNLDLDIYQNSVICKSCNDVVMATISLQHTWLATEEKLNVIVENEKNNSHRNSNLVLLAEEVGTNGDISVKPQTIDESLLITRRLRDEMRENKKLLWGLGPFMCEICGVIYLTKRVLQRHLWRHRQQGEESRVCEVCGSTFESLKELKKHCRKHQRYKPKFKVHYQCTICFKLFTTKASLQEHLNHRHYKRFNPVQCHLCGKKLLSRKTLTHHMRTHKPPRFSCEICGKAFTFLKSLQKHSKTHSNTQYECELCGKRVKYEENLEKHIGMFHRNESKNQCNFCGKLYWKKWDMDKHKIRIHGWSANKDEN